MIVKVSYVLLFILLISVIFNSVYISRFTEKLYALSKEGGHDSIEELELKFEKINRIYRSNEIFISLTVSHEDLTNIEDILSEINGAIESKDVNSVIIAKSRFESAVLHLGQLSAINIDSIF